MDSPDIELTGSSLDTFISLLNNNPELAYSSFVKRCNQVSSRSEEVLAVVNFLSSNTDSRSAAARRSLLQVSDQLDPTWEAFVGSRLNCDLDCPSMFAKRYETKGSPFHLHIESKIHQPSRRESGQDSVKMFLEGIFLSTHQTLEMQDRLPENHPLVFNGRSISKFFGLHYSTSSVVLAKNHCRRIPYKRRKDMVKLLIADCKRQQTFFVHANMLADLPMEDEKSDIDEMLCEQLAESDNNQQFDFLKSYVKCDELFLEAVTTLRPDASGSQPFVPFLQSLKDDAPQARRHSEEGMIQNPVSTPTGMQVCRLPVSDVCEPIVFSVNNFLDDNLRLSLLDSLNEVPFMKGTDGRSNSYIRVVTNNNQHDHTYFQIGRNLYPCLSASDPESMLIDVINTLIERQNTILDDKSFGTFVKKLAFDIEDIFEDCFFKTAAPGRATCLTKLANNIHSRIEESKTHLNERNASDEKCKWLAHQVLADLEEIFEDPFGQITSESIAYGPGAKQG